MSLKVKKPFYTIVTVTYNAISNLRKTVDSVRKQSFYDYEHLIIDGASTDRTVEYLSLVSGDKIRYISEEDFGIYDAMNKSIDLAEGKYLLFLNAGDCFASDYVLEDVFHSISKVKGEHPKVVYGGANVYGHDNKYQTALMPFVLNKRNLNLFATRTVCHQAIFIELDSAIKYNRNYRLKAELNWYYDIVKKIHKNMFLKLDSVICNYYLGGTGDINFLENFRERIKVTFSNNNFIKFILLAPFLILPLLFRARRKLLER